MSIYPFYWSQNETLEVVVISDLWDPISGTAQLTWLDWTGAEIESSVVEFTAPALNFSEVLNVTGLDNILPKTKQGKKGKKKVADKDDVWLLVNVTANAGDTTYRNEQHVSIDSHS